MYTHLHTHKDRKWMSLKQTANDKIMTAFCPMYAARLEKDVKNAIFKNLTIWIAKMVLEKQGGKKLSEKKKLKVNDMFVLIF